MWISFVEGLRSTFNLQDNKPVHNSLKKKEFRLAGVPHYKETDLSPIQVTEILSLSTPDQRREFCQIIHDEFGYQNDVDMRKFEQMCRKDGEKSAAQYQVC